MRRWRYKVPCLAAMAMVLFLWFRYLDNPWAKAEGESSTEDEGDDDEDDDRAFRELTKLVLATEMLCLVAEQMGKGPHAHTLCKQTPDSKMGASNITLVSLESRDLSFEEALASRSLDNRVYVLTANSSHLGANLAPNLHPVALSGLEANVPSLSKSVWVREVEALMSSSAPVNVLKLSSTASFAVGPWMLRSLLDDRYVSRVQQLLLVVEATDPVAWRQWARVLVRLRDEGGFFAFHAQNSEPCSANRCRYVTSWLKGRRSRSRSAPEVLRAPSHGPGRDGADEALGFLFEVTARCSRRLSVPAPSPSSSLDRAPSPRASDWPVCLDELRPPCLAYSVRTGGGSGAAVFEDTLEILGCSVFAFDPTFARENFTLGTRNGVRGFPWGVRTETADETQAIEGTDRVYLTPTEIVSRLGHRDRTVDVLHVNARGGEWAILGAFESCGLLTRVRQIVATVHVWFGEESFNLAARSAQARRLKGLGFEAFFSEAMVAGSEKTQDCCRVVGWVRRR